jgi:DNA polymerase-3 subunit gamma/tau
VIEIDGASNRGIDEIRTLRENVKFSPVSGKFKVYIIDEVHMLTPEAFNALLKTLEEPPKFVKFIFATTQPHKVIPTILSRCQRLDFRRIPSMEVVGQLEKIIAAENIDIDKEVLFAIAKASDGSLRDAESVLDQLVSFSKDKVSLKDVISILGLIEQGALFELADFVIRKDAKAALGLLNNIIDQGKDLSVFLAGLIEHFRNLMIAKVIKVSSGDSGLLDLPEDFTERLFKQAQAFSLDEIFSAFNILVNTQELSKRLESLRIPLEISLVKLAYDKKGSSLNTSKEPTADDKPPFKHNVHENDSITGKETTIKETKKQESASLTEGIKQTISLENLRNSWLNIIEKLSVIKMSVATYLNEGSPIKVENNILTVAFPKDYSLHKESLERQENRAIIEKTILELFNSPLRVNFILSQEVSPREEHKDSFIKSTLQTFKGRVIREG